MSPLRAMLKCSAYLHISDPCVTMSFNISKNKVNGSRKASKEIKEKDASQRVPGEPTAQTACRAICEAGKLSSLGVDSSKGTHEQLEDVLELCCFPPRPLQD